MATGALNFGRHVEIATSVNASSQVSRLYRPELDVLRFFAFLLVLMRHGVVVDEHGSLHRHHPQLATIVTYVQSMGGFGLPLFFFLSSFLITTLLMLERENSGSIHLARFYLRRSLRIYPLYFVFLSAMFALGHLWSPAHISLGGLSAYFLLSGNWYNIAVFAVPETIAFLWSISVEEQFYLLWPAAIRRLTMRQIELLCLGIALVSCLTISGLASRGVLLRSIWFNSVPQMLFFAAGAVLALRTGLVRRAKSFRKSMLCLGSGLTCWLTAESLAGSDPMNIALCGSAALMFYLLIAAGCAAMLFGFLQLPSLFVRPSFVYLGRISYGLYVFHGLVLLAVPRLLGNYMPHGGLWLGVVLLVVISLAMLSYELFEKRFLTLKQRFAFVQSRAV